MQRSKCWEKYWSKVLEKGKSNIYIFLFVFIPAPDSLASSWSSHEELKHNQNKNSWTQNTHKMSRKHSGQPADSVTGSLSPNPSTVCSCHLASSPSSCFCFPVWLHLSLSGRTFPPVLEGGLLLVYNFVQNQPAGHENFYLGWKIQKPQLRRTDGK